MISNIQSLVQKIAAKRGITTEMQAATVCQKYRRIAPQILGSDILNHTSPKSYKKQILTIATENSAWSQEIHMNKLELLTALQTEIPPNLLKDIKVIVESNKHY